MARRGPRHATWDNLDEIAAWQRAGEPSLEAPVIDLEMLGDWDCRYVTPA